MAAKDGRASSVFGVLSARGDGPWRSPHRSGKHLDGFLKGLSGSGGFTPLSVCLQKRSCLVTTGGRPGKGLKGWGKTNLGSKTKEEQGRHSKTQTEGEHEIPMTHAVPSLTRQIYPVHIQGLPSPPLFLVIINLGFSKGKYPVFHSGDQR